MHLNGLTRAGDFASNHFNIFFSSDHVNKRTISKIHKSVLKKKILFFVHDPKPCWMPKDKHSGKLCKRLEDNLEMTFACCSSRAGYNHKGFCEKLFCVAHETVSFPQKP